MKQVTVETIHSVAGYQVCRGKCQIRPDWSRNHIFNAYNVSSEVYLCMMVYRVIFSYVKCIPCLITVVSRSCSHLVMDSKTFFWLVKNA